MKEFTIRDLILEIKNIIEEEENDLKNKLIYRISVKNENNKALNIKTMGTTKSIEKLEEYLYDCKFNKEIYDISEIAKQAYRVFSFTTNNTHNDVILEAKKLIRESFFDVNLNKFIVD